MGYPRFTATSFVMLVLVGSVAVAGVLARQVMTAEQQRRQVTDTMLRDYARLAAWEFSREATRDIEMALMRTLADRVHQARHTGDDSCDCEPIAGVDEWFEVLKPGAAGGRTDVMEGRLQMRRSDTDGRLIALRWDSHVGPAGGEIGLKMSPQALRPVLERTHRRAELLPSLLADGREAARLVDLRVLDRDGRELFASPDTAPGPHGFEANLLPNAGFDLRVSTSMTPAFVASLAAEHGAGPSRALIVGLVIVNALLVTVGVWQLKRERELTRLRTNFVAGVSHELRTPLAQIRMFADTLLLDRVRSPDERRRAVEVISRETQRLGQLVDNVLVFHRQEPIRALDAAEPIDLSSLVRDVTDGFRPIAAARRMEILCEPGNDRPSILGNADGLRQVLLNLLDNAVKFGPAGQTITVSLDRSSQLVRLAVQDSGPGVPEGDRQRIFKAFERGHDTRGTGGAGIGLSVVHQIVHAHSGTVAVETPPGGGARFIVDLPAADGTGPEEAG